MNVNRDKTALFCFLNPSKAVIVHSLHTKPMKFSKADVPFRPFFSMLFYSVYNIKSPYLLFSFVAGYANLF